MAIEIENSDDLLALEKQLGQFDGRSASSKPDLLNFLWNDHGNCCRLRALHGENLRYCHAFKKWLVWDQKRWAVDETGQARRLAKDAMLEFLSQAVQDRAGEKTEKFATGALNSRRIDSMLSMAESELYVLPKDLDTNPFLLNFLNGTVDLRTDILRPHERMDFLTKLVAFRYEPRAECPAWLAFLRQIMGSGSDIGSESGDRQTRLTNYLQRAFGYSLTGCTIEKAVFVLFGDGNNGKSTLLSTFRQLVDEYSVLLQADTLMVRQESNNTQADLADLRGARFVQTSETEEGQRLAQGKLKRITQGMGKIKAVRKYENPIEFPETHKLWMDTNRKPMTRDADDLATFNRLHPIPFLVRIPKHQIDRDLPAKLMGEAEGILAWAVAGAALWHAQGLSKPLEVQLATQTWQSDTDQVGRFLTDICILEERASCLSSQLYAAYKHWGEVGREENLMAQRKFAAKLSDRDGITSVHCSQGTQYRGIGLRAVP